jgi:hypothetical protein
MKCPVCGPNFIGRCIHRTRVKRSPPPIVLSRDEVIFQAAERYADKHCVSTLKTDPARNRVIRDFIQGWNFSEVEVTNIRETSQEISDDLIDKIKQIRELKEELRITQALRRVTERGLMNMRESYYEELFAKNSLEIKVLQLTQQNSLLQKKLKNPKKKKRK